MMSCALLWWIGRRMDWTTRLVVTAHHSCRHHRRSLVRTLGLLGGPHDIGGARNWANPGRVANCANQRSTCARGRLAHAFDSEPATGISAERDIGNREVVALDEAPARQLGIDDAPYHCLGIDIPLDRNHVPLFDRGSHQGQNTGRSTGCTVESVQSSQRSTAARRFGASG